MTLYLDCVKVDTLDLLRGSDPHISTEGVTVFGTRLLDEGVFEVEPCVCVTLVKKKKKKENWQSIKRIRTDSEFIVCVEELSLLVAACLIA